VQVKAVADQRMKHYKVICFLGVALITWIDKAVFLNRLNEYNNVAAQVCIIYFTIALVSMLLGLTASSFPDSALCAKTVSSNGALQAFLFLNAVVHLHNIDLYPKVLHLGVSWMLTSLVFCIYRAMSALKVKGILLLCHLVAKLYGAKEFCGMVCCCDAFVNRNRRRN
jgi:hypothetical protein